NIAYVPATRPWILGRKWIDECVKSKLFTKNLLSRFDGQWKLLAWSLFSGVSGAHRALEVLRRQQRAGPGSSLSDFIETLCRDEISCPGMDGAPFTVQPLVWLFPPLFQQNLLTFIYLVHSRFHKAAVLRLLLCLGQDPHPDPWVTAWKKQLERTLGCPMDEPLYSPACAQRLTALSRRVGGETGGWAQCSGLQAEEPQTAPVLSEAGTHKKRKGHFDALNNEDEEIQMQKKRMRTDEHTAGRAHDHENYSKVRPRYEAHLVVFVYTWDHRSLDVFEVLNNWNATQVLMCGELRLSDLAEHALPQLCNCILALSPDLSFSTALTLIKNLLLPRVLALFEPASRCLVSVVMSFCSRYTRSMCHGLIGPLLEQENLGSAQAELLNKLIEGCIDSHNRLFVMTLKISWNDTLLSIIHSLLDSEPDMNEELFTQLIEQLVSQALPFTKSVNFAKTMLTVLTKYGNLVNASHKQSLSGCLMLNETFLKKSLQAVLKRIPDA
uniref:FA complementation group E n=1 Tax=Hippocampus comes TaxID=109280 RepID=A0A3Q3D9K4_HIPCM